MELGSLSRRRFLVALADALGVSTVALNWPEVAGAAHHADAAAQAAHAPPTKFFTPADAADVDAIAATIIPDGALPGARAAGVINFIDRDVGSAIPISRRSPRSRQSVGSNSCARSSTRPSLSKCVC